MGLKIRLRWFWRVGPWQALSESLALGIGLALGLVAVSDRIPPNSLGMGFLFLSASCALWCALRLRVSDDLSWWRRLLWEGAVALGLSLALGGGVSVLLSVLAEGWERIDQANVGSAGVLFILLASGPLLAGFRVGVGVWHVWERMRRRRLLWSLTHAHLTVVVLVVALFAILASVQVMFSTSLVDLWTSSDFSAALVDTLTRTIFPLASIILVVLIILLAVLLPPSALFSYIVARRTTRRLEALAEAARALRQGDLSARVPVVGEDEVAQLQMDFNRMAVDLERAAAALEAERDKVTALLQSRRELVASVSHELGTPVATVRGYLESALGSGGERQGSEEMPPGLRRDLEVMAGEVERLDSLIDDLFALSRAEVDGLTLDLRPTDVGAVAQRRVEAMAPLAWQSGRVELVAELDQSATARALVDERRLEQVLNNLLRNGVRHTPPGGIVAVVVTTEAGAVCVEVRDTGEGIPPQDLDRIWERFYRGGNAQAGDGRGAGLGLALVKELVEAMGGTVAVESVVGEGSCFTVRLPAARATTPPS